MRHSNPQMLNYIAMADAATLAVEYNSAMRDHCLRFQRYLAHPTHGLAPGAYSDDTEMSVANAKVLIQHYDEPLTPLMFAEAYVREFALGGRRKGYSRGFQVFLEEVTTGEEFLVKIRPDSVKNGAAMRAVPFGVLPTVDRVLEVATLQARITHDTPEGRFSARAVALMSHAALYEDRPLADLGRYCQKHLPEEDIRYFDVFVQPWSGGPVKSTPRASVAITTVHAVVSVLAREKSLMGILRQIILWGGDTDSVAAIAWGIASTRYQKSEVIPLFMPRDLEGGSLQTGTFNLSIVGTLLMAKYNKEQGGKS